MLCDFHLHTDFSGDCSIPPYQQIERAIALGIKRICITDHHDYDVVSDCDFNLDLPAYFPALQQLRETYQGQIQIEIGIELGLQSHIAGYLQDLTRQYPFDFIIGSNHFINGMDPYYPSFFEGRSEQDACRLFFEVTLKRLRDMDCFDSLGHLDYVIRYFPSHNREYHLKDYQEYLDPILKTLIEKGKSLECNTSGFHHHLGHPNPCEEVLRRYLELGGELLTIGSDAHSPEYIGYEFNRTARLLKECGFRYYTVYHERKPEFLPL